MGMIQLIREFDENLINNQYPQNQTENDETAEAEYPKDSDSEREETNKTSALTNFMSQTLPDDKVAEVINSVNLQQRKSSMWFRIGQDIT